MASSTTSSGVAGALEPWDTASRLHRHCHQRRHSMERANRLQLFHASSLARHGAVSLGKAVAIAAARVPPGAGVTTASPGRCASCLLKSGTCIKIAHKTTKLTQHGILTTLYCTMCAWLATTTSSSPAHHQHHHYHCSCSSNCSLTITITSTSSMCPTSEW